MGTHNSKESHQLKSSTNDNNTWRQSIPSSNKIPIINKQTVYHGWQEIYRCTHPDWLHGISGK
jgi:hypothetical protein